MNTFEEWIQKLTCADELCASYYDKVKKSMSNKQLVDIVTDANGMTYLCEMQAKGIPLPYEVITSRFSSFINGRYVAEHKNDKGNGYTSQIYCCYQGKIEMKETLLTLLGCTCSVYVAENHICQIYLDKNCDVIIACPSSSKAIVHYWGDKEPEYSGNVEFVKET